MCKFCEPGRYAGTLGLSECTVCSQGQFRAGGGAASCANCSPGRFQDEVEKTSCKACALGQHQASAGTATCNLCTKGHFTDSVGQASCSACSPGWFANSIGQHFCEMCPVGQFAGSPATITCSSCATDRYANEKGMDRCLECDYYCPKGQHKAKCGNHMYGSKFDSRPSACVQCPTGQFKANAGTERQCTPWRKPCPFPAQWESVTPNHIDQRVCTDHPECRPGNATNDMHAVGTYEYRAAATHLPRQCRKHTECDFENEWMNKAAGTHHDRECTPLTTCQPGFFESTPKTHTSDRKCSLCPLGTHKFEARNALTCDVCPVGFRSRPHRRSCEAFKCSHVTCKNETHTCGFSRADHPFVHHIRAYRGAFTALPKNNCDGRKYTTIRTNTGGNKCNVLSDKFPHAYDRIWTKKNLHIHTDERPCDKAKFELKEHPCKDGHHCGMGIVTGDMLKCECAPLNVWDYKVAHL